MRISDWSSDACSSDLAVGERRQRQGVGAEEHRALAVADRKRRAAARADHEVVAPGEDDGQREGAFQALQCRRHGLLRRHLAVEIAGDQMHHGFGVGLGLELVADGLQFRSEEHTSELQSLMRISYAVFCLKKKKY